MSSLYDLKSYTNIIDRLKDLNPTSQRQWGKMNVGQMMAHCSKPFDLALGRERGKRGLIGILFGGIAKKQFVNSNKPFKPNLPTSPSFVMVDERNFDIEQQKLIENIKEFYTNGKEAITKDPHPFFGKMNADEWGRLLHNHLDHHLKQFGK